MSEPLKAVEADAETTPEGVEVPLVTAEGEFTILVPPTGKWKTRAIRAADSNDIDLWAEIVLGDDDWKTWANADPTLEDAATFINKWQELAGENRGKSRTSRSSSRSTARR